MPSVFLPFARPIAACPREGEGASLPPRRSRWPYPWVVLAMLATLGAGVGFGCRDQASIPSGPSVPSNATRFLQIRDLLGKDPDSTERAMRLYPLVAPVCADESERIAFVEGVKWSSSFSKGNDKLPSVLAADTVEHVATSCFRTSSVAAFDILGRASAAIPGELRFELVIARLRAAGGELDLALDSARRAMKAGSVHAIALAANIQAQSARDKDIGYAPGMLDEAIRTVSVEPTESWSVIDLSAVLASKAQLLSERAIWEQPDQAANTIEEARPIYERCAVAPFIEATRSRALDMLCFDSTTREEQDAFQSCRRAADEAENLGAAWLSAKLDPVQPGGHFDLERKKKIEELQESVARLPSGTLVLVVSRGDESELVPWIRPAASLLRSLGSKGATLVSVDRTYHERATALVDRMFALAEVTPVARFLARRDPLALPCLAAVLADRRAPRSCPFDAGKIEKLGQRGKLAFALLIGRDLDAEISDFRLYDHRTVLLSFRESAVENGPDLHLKNVSDVAMVAPSLARAGRRPTRAIREPSVSHP